MQAPLVTYVQPSLNNADPAAEAPSNGQGMKMNSAHQSKTTESLFTAILRQGISVAIPGTSGLGTQEIPLIINSDDPKKEGQDGSVDICSLLIQLLMANSQINGGGDKNGPDETALNGLMSMINEIPDVTNGALQKGLEEAASALLGNDGNAAEVLGALTALTNSDVPPESQTNSGPVPFNGVLAKISEALKNELAQDTSAQDTGAQDVPVSETAEAANLNIETLNNPVRQNTTVIPAGADKSNGAAQQDKTAPASDSVITAGETDEKTGGAVQAAGGSDSESGFSELFSRDKNKNQGMAAAESGVNRVMSETASKVGTTAEKTTAVERALNKFTDDLRSFRGGTQEIRIVLEPESLGVLTISVIKTESGISAKIKSEDKEIAAIISDHVQKLITSMESKGIKVNDVDVAYSQTEQNPGFGQHGFSQSRDESSRRYILPVNKNSDVETPNGDIWQALYGGATSGDTNVDYRI